MRYLSLVVFVVCSFFLISSASAEVISGKVVYVYDGDTVQIKLPSGKKKKIRFYGVDTPESSQEHGQAAKRFTKSKLHNKEVDVLVVDIDKYKRVVGIIMPKSSNVAINESLVSNGHAWVYTQFCRRSFCNDWIAKEKQAKKSHRGLWKSSNPQEPWMYRRSK